MAEDSPRPTRSPADAPVYRLVPDWSAARDHVFVEVPLPQPPVEPAALTRLCFELVKAVNTSARSRSSLELRNLSRSCHSLNFVVETAPWDEGVEALMEEFRRIVQTFADAERRGTEPSPCCPEGASIKVL